MHQLFVMLSESVLNRLSKCWRDMHAGPLAKPLLPPQPQVHAREDDLQQLCGRPLLKLEEGIDRRLDSVCLPRELAVRERVRPPRDLVKVCALPPNLREDLAEHRVVDGPSSSRQAVTRNPGRFSERLRFKLTNEKSQILTSRSVISRSGNWGGRRKPPRVFTEQGVSMLFAVLRSGTAIDASVRIIDAFVEMRHFIADNAHMFEQVRSIDRRLGSLERSTDARFERVFDYMGAHEAPSQKALFEGQAYDAFGLLVSLVQRARCLIASELRVVRFKPCFGRGEGFEPAAFV